MNEADLVSCKISKNCSSEEDVHFCTQNNGRQRAVMANLKLFVL